MCTDKFKMRNRPGSIKPADNAAFGVQPQGYGANLAAKAPAAVDLAYPF
jgi:hypothetical protein